MAPSAVNSSNEKLLLSTVYNNIKAMGPFKYNVGDHVRISKYKHVFEKGYTPNCTAEIFKIREIRITNPVTYLLEDYEGNKIEGGFYEPELLKAEHPSIYLVEKILKRNGNQGFVKWLGFSTKHNSWINTKDMIY
ncbi:uncharacterized protein LOC119652069 [Hermetia illucens]|uniref:uncharacterized protein LOC119652069 n=1 Tax=Hermetia illucens TaxID=343691 RepID=UPI0018CC52F7|nr:uncharacterized protein LOC119652069 [Hermetia illucens]